MCIMWKLLSVHLEMMLILTQDGYIVCAKHTRGLEIIWMHRMVLLGDLGHVEPYFGSFGDIVSVSARLVHGLHQTYHRLRNHFGSTQ
jgi:hypothetical protein